LFLAPLSLLGAVAFVGVVAPWRLGARARLTVAAVEGEKEGTREKIVIRGCALLAAKALLVNKRFPSRVESYGIGAPASK
jgi:hypothetical protein